MRSMAWMGVAGGVDGTLEATDEAVDGLTNRVGEFLGGVFGAAGVVALEVVELFEFA